MIKHKKIIISLILFSVVLVCCKSHAPVTKSVATTPSPTPVSKPATNSPSLVPDDNDVTIAQSHWPGTSLMTLAEGYTLYTDECTKCHKPKLPQDFSADEWNSILPKMGRKAHLDSIQYVSVYRYILTKRESIQLLK